uniref:Uncharacterized protein n=1 Tax=Cacopsylla melanoneura TaxID=428564 RepID=A0A8D8LZH3_9HEMI
MHLLIFLLHSFSKCIPWYRMHQYAPCYSVTSLILLSYIIIIIGIITMFIIVLHKQTNFTLHYICTVHSSFYIALLNFIMHNAHSWVTLVCTNYTMHTCLILLHDSPIHLAIIYFIPPFFGCLYILNIH